MPAQQPPRCTRVDSRECVGLARRLIIVDTESIVVCTSHLTAGSSYKYLRARTDGLSTPMGPPYI